MAGAFPDTFFLRPAWCFCWLVVYCLLRKSGVDRWLAVAGCAAVLAGSSVQDAFLTIREDGLAAALNVWGVALCAGEYSRRRLYISAVLFALAFATKETSVFGAAGLILALLVSRKVGDGVRLGIATAIGYAAVIVTMYAASGGRAFEGLRLTLATGSGFYSLLNSPITMAEAMNGYREEMILLALALTAFALTRARLRLPGLWFLCTLAVTLVIFSSEGTAGNHLIDLLVASVAVFTVWISDLSSPDLGMSLLASAALVAWLGLMVQHRYDDLVPVHSQLREIVRATGNSGRPILSDNPLVPLEAGQRPYVLDAFMFRVLQERVPNFGDRCGRCLSSAVSQRWSWLIIRIAKKARTPIPTITSATPSWKSCGRTTNRREAPERNTFLYRATIPPEFTKLPP